jgi:hypothetical protein
MPIMGAVKPWHLILLSLCCMVTLTVAVAGGIWAARRSRSKD